MLLRLSVYNFIIIEQAGIEFGPGLNLFTGETGVGKSLIIEAIDLLLGKRSSNECIRKGEQEATIEGIFLDSSGRLTTELAGSGISPDDNNSFIVRRIISKSAWKNRCFINDTSVNLSTISKIRNHFAEVHSQAGHFQYLQEENQLPIIDRFAHLVDNLNEYKIEFEKSSDLSEELTILKSKESNRVERLDYLRFVIDEIESAELISGEEEDLQKEIKILLNAQMLRESSTEIYDLLYDNDTSVIDLLSEIEEKVEGIVKIDDSLADAKFVEEASILLQEFGNSIRQYKESVDVNPYRLEEVEKRIDSIERLKKYGATIDLILEKKEKFDNELNDISESENRTEELTELLEKQSKKVLSMADSLSKKRQKATKALCSAVMKELSELMMPEASFKIEFKPIEACIDGIDGISFLLSPNPGEGYGKLTEVASGGELSRITLGIKTLLKEKIPASVIFDEVDTGIGGEAANAVGKKLKEIAGRSQVFCVTHLPQIAAFADHHYLVVKQAESNRTVSLVTHLESDKDRTSELSRMLSGEDRTDITIKHAEQILLAAKNYKK